MGCGVAGGGLEVAGVGVFEAEVRVGGEEGDYAAGEEVLEWERGGWLWLGRGRGFAV